MALFLVDYVHPDPVGWSTHLKAHLEWIVDEVEAGRLLISGPTVAGDDRSATLVFEVTDRATLDAVIATDPYMVHGQVSDLAVRQWDPLFGRLNELSSVPRQGSAEVVAALSKTFNL